jgi:hypothetical protein
MGKLGQWVLVLVLLIRDAPLCIVTAWGQLTNRCRKS